MKRFWIYRMLASMIIITIVAILAYRNNPNLHRVQAELSAGTILLPDDTVEYLQNSLLYGNYYNEGQRFVIYFQDQNIYPENFLPTLKKIKDSPELYAYAFLPRPKDNPDFLTSEQKSDQKLIELCHQFCIINPAKEELFYINGIKAEDTQELPHIFHAVENW